MSQHDIDRDPVSGCGCLILIIILALCFGKPVHPTPSTPAATTPATTTASTDPAPSLPMENIALENVSTLPSGTSAWIAPESLFISGNEVFVFADADVSADYKTNYIKITNNNASFSVNLSGTKYKWKNPLESTSTTKKVVNAVKISKIEPEIPIEK